LPALALGLAGLLAWATVPVAEAEAATTPNVPAEAGLISANQRAAADRAKAASISAQIQSEGLLLAKYAERADAESVRSAQLDTRLRATRRAATSATEHVRTTRSLLVEQAIAAYTNGGAFSYGPGTVEGTGLVVAAAYADAVAQRQQLALSDYRQALARDKTVFSELSSQKASVRAATLLLNADRAAATAQQSSLRATLAGVKGDLAVDVADVQRQQAAVQVEEEKAFLQSINQLPKATPLMAADRSASAGADRAGAGARGAGAGARGAASGPGGPGQPGNENTSTGPTTSTTSATQSVATFSTVVSDTEAPTTAEPVPAPTPAPPSTTTSTAPVPTSAPTSTAPVPTSAPTTTLAPTTTTMTSAPPSTTSTSATPLSSTTVASTSTSVASTSASWTSSAVASTLASTTAAPATSLSTTTTAASEVRAPADGNSYSSSSAAGSSGAELSSPSTAAGGGMALSTTPTTTASSASAIASAGLPPVGGQTALAFAESQIGKPYQWGGAGPATYDCSGLVMVAWGKAGVYMPHSAQDQYDMTARVPIADLQPGDLVFFGTPTDVYHVGMYVGGGEMVDAPETGQDVMIQPIYELNLLAGGRPS
jgi:peptidoglycan DL-endopeptidase CwlO